MRHLGEEPRMTETVRHVPFNRPALAGREFDYMREAVAAGHLSGDGIFTARAQAALQDLLGAPKVLLTTSCTHALEMAALLLDIGPGDEIIVPSFTFVSTANAFVMRGAIPRFADVRPDTLNIDESQLEPLLSSRTRAILAVHYAGVACEMDRILEIAAQHGAAVVEDNAHGLFGRYKGRQTGTFGTLSTLSFHETKNVTCGEGGALVLNDPAFVERAEIIREKGTDRSKFFRGHVDKYSWVDLGSSYLPSDLLAAFLCAQLESAERMQARRRQLWRRYVAELEPWACRTGARLPVVPVECEQPHHLFYMLLPSGERRDALIEHLKARGVYAVFHYLPLHLSTMGVRFGGTAGDCPVTEDVSARLVRLPLFPDLSDAEQDRVISAVAGFA
jgi:dTDP-4-amino-4,6-dideoxygalactose transaminase